jgi:hypothetical protein
MRLLTLLLCHFASLITAQTASSQLVFTYQTLTGGTVKFTSTTYQTEASSTSTTELSTNYSSYSVNTANLVYPTWSAVPSTLATSPAAPGLLNATQFTAEAIDLIFLLKVANSTNCQMCKDVMSTVVQSMKVQQDLLYNIAVPFCAPLAALIPTPVCEGLLRVASTDIGGIFPSIDMQGIDGQTLCAFMFGLCELPAPPELNLDTLFKGTKKSDKELPKPCGEEPLKVLHISDYHLDQRYVVGSEANCGGSVCCRVFPYTNLSAPINQSASLFGNYQCDTPEPLATSVFRSVPNVTGFEWSDFSFGIFTGKSDHLVYLPV